VFNLVLIAEVCLPIAITTIAIPTAIPTIAPVDRLMDPVSEPSAPGSLDPTTDPTLPSETPPPSTGVILGVADGVVDVVEVVEASTVGNESAARTRRLRRNLSILAVKKVFRGEVSEPAVFVQVGTARSRLF
jgi:hypothetical protein